MNKRQAHRVLTDMGFVCKAGSRHECWQHPDGRMITLPTGPVEQLYGYVAVKIRKWSQGRMDGKQGSFTSDRGGAS